VENEMLAQAASSKAEAIFSEGTFAHEINGEKFSNWVKSAGYKYSYIGENLAIDFITAEGAVKAWFGSLTHKQNILNPRFSETGIAVKEGTFNNVNTILVVQIFGAPLYSLSAPISHVGINPNNGLWQDNYLSSPVDSLAQKNVYYFENNYLDATDPSAQLFLPEAEDTQNSYFMNIEKNFLPQNNASLFWENLNMIFILTLILSLTMTLVYLFSNHLKEKQINYNYKR
jgi:hypothetical protein